jgi:hypothetical protein
MTSAAWSTVRGPQRAARAEITHEVAPVPGAPIADVRPPLPRFVVGRSGVAQGDQQWCHPSVDVANGGGVDGQLPLGRGFELLRELIERAISGTDQPRDPRPGWATSPSRRTRSLGSSAWTSGQGPSPW